VQRSIELARATAVSREQLANWPPEVGDAPRLVQWCHGAPGMITALAGVPAGVDRVFDELLEHAGELVFRAGPLVKGAGLCHGTAGNGYAFLALYRRTGAERWLERARAFAMHAMSQHEYLLARWKRPWFSLWTGDLGLAVYLADCLNGSGGLPFLDRLELAGSAASG
jgi:lantibiotic modifying enzyme